MFQVFGKMIGAAIVASSLAAVPIHTAQAQTEVVGAIAGALAAQQMAADAEASPLASQAEKVSTESRDALCGRMRDKLRQYETRTSNQERLAEAYRKTCVR